VTVSNHLRDLPQLTHSVKYEVITAATRDALTAAWKAWVEETGACRCACCVLVCVCVCVCVPGGGGGGGVVGVGGR
jgi:hypothetical protein